MNQKTHASPTDPFSVVLTKQEIEVLLGLLDLGVKAGGLSVAANAAVLHQKIQAATPVAPPAPPAPSAPEAEQPPF
jgi:hypothetical protein